MINAKQKKLLVIFFLVTLVGVLFFAKQAGSQTTLSGSVNFQGNLTITGAISKGAGTFAIDHPLDPTNKLLYHSFVESPEPKNVYDGVVELDKNGEATVALPDYYEALNGTESARFLLTPIGKPAPDLYIKENGISNNQFVIAGGLPDTRVSWQVTGVRQDPYIKANPIVVEVEKGPDELVDKGEFVWPAYPSN